MILDDFTEMLIRNNDDEILSYIFTYGKKPHPVSPIFMFDAVNQDELSEYKKNYGIS